MRLSSLCLLAGLLLFTACETPGDPDFSLEHSIDAPVTVNKNIRFLGQHNAFIDTTGSQYDSLFTVGGDGLVSLSRQEDFDFGDLEDAVPSVDVEPVTFNTQIGEIEIGSFASGQITGSAGFTQITGLDESLFSEGDPIPSGSTPGSVNISLDTDYFVSAVIEEGSLSVTLENNLGFDIDQITISLNSGSTTVDDAVITNFTDASQAEALFTFVSGTLLEDINVDLTASWSSQVLQRDPENVLITQTRGENLRASQVTAAVPSQHFTAGGQVILDDQDFQFTDPGHYVELEAGELQIFDIINQIDLDLDTLRISFPGIRRSPYNPEDSLVVEFAGATAISGGSTGSTQRTIDISGLRAYAQNNSLDYNIVAVTENTTESTGSEIRTIQSSDEVSATMEINGLELREAVGILVPREVLLNDDNAANGTGVIDLFDDTEAQVTELDGLDDLSGQLSGLQFADPVLSVPYQTNLGTPATVIGAILGIDENGNRVYLRGNQGSPNFVSPSEVSPALQAQGTQLTGEELIKFDIDPSSDGTLINGVEQFTTDNTNIDAFMSNLPTSIRFIGLANLNENSQEGTIVNPVVFDPGLDVNIPLNLSVVSSTYSDTAEADLGDLPGPEDTSRSIEEATINIAYENRLPFQMSLSLVLLDEQQNAVTAIPLSGQQELLVQGAPVDPATGFVQQMQEGNMVISLSKEQLDIINRSRNMALDIELNTTDQQQVKVRADDSINLKISLSAAVQSNVN